MKIKVLHIADLHLGSRFPSLGEKEPIRQKDLLRTFERLLALAIKNEVDLFLIAGDLFDHPRPDVALIGAVQAGVRRLADRGIPTVLLPGTHDHTVLRDSIYRHPEFPGAIVLNSPALREPIEILIREIPVYLYGFAFQGFASENAMAGMRRRPQEGIHLGLLHGSRKGNPEWEHRAKDLPFSMEDLKTWNLDYMALGHYHSFEVLEEGNRRYACYPGSPEGRRFGENGPRYCALVHIEPENAFIEKIPVQHRTLEERTLDIAGCREESEAAARISALGDPDLLLRLTMTGIVEAPIVLDRLTSRCAGDFFHLDLQDRTQLFDSHFARRIESEQTIRGLFVQRVRRLMEDMPEEERPVMEEAFREVLVRFRAFDGGSQ